MNKFEIQRNDGFVRPTLVVDWLDIGFGSGTDILGTYCAGVCLAVTLYDPITTKGGLAHIHPKKEYNPEEIYPDRVVSTLLKEVNGTLKDHSRLEASMVGETYYDNGGPISKIVERSIHAMGIQLIGRDHGKMVGRDVQLYCENGRVVVYRH